eukprot:SAG31_NODE_16361_length_712_cov_0.792822_1_plen_90_part_00
MAGIFSLMQASRSRELLLLLLLLLCPTRNSATSGQKSKGSDQGADSGGRSSTSLHTTDYDGPYGDPFVQCQPGEKNITLPGIQVIIKLN